jgi:3-deoxy-D-manno-octulosonic-acid transferase
MLTSGTGWRERKPYVSYLLNLAYLLLILAATPWLLYAAVRKGKYRRGFAAKLLGRVPRRTSERTCIWLHAVSVGEVNLLAPLLREIRRQRPDWECVVSTTWSWPSWSCGRT